MVDFVLAGAALLGFGAFLAIIAIFVPHIDLVAIIAISFALATHDFFRELAATRREAAAGRARRERDRQRERDRDDDPDIDLDEEYT